MGQTEKGFTLIELVIVITLLGILAATALPKFANLTGAAYSATNNGVGGALASAVNIAHAAYIASGQTIAGRVNLECNPTGTAAATGNIYLSAQGWPTNAGGPTTSAGQCVVSGTGTTTPTAEQCANIWNNIMTNPPVAAGGDSPGAPASPADCAATNGVCYQVSSTANNTCTYQMYYNTTVVSPTRSVAYNLGNGGIAIVSP